MAAQECLSNRYRLVRWVGAGGMSVVWSAFDEVLQRPVAVKLPAMPADDELRQRVQYEARAAARLVHPHIASVYDYGETESDGGESSPYVVMELVTGEPLSHRLAGAGSLPWREAATICAQIASALAEAHANDVVHRDVKPANVLLTATGAKLVDFGIAAAVGEPEGGSDLLGTPAYIAPERIARTLVGPPADVYGLGVVLYRALAGRMPWQAWTVPEMLSAHLATDPAPLPVLPGVPEEVVRICEACLAKEPGARPSSMDMASTLAAAADVAVPLPRPQHPAVASGPAAPRRPHLSATLVSPPPIAAVTTGEGPWRPRVAHIAAALAAVLAVTLVTAAAWDRPGGSVRLATASGQPAQYQPFECGVSYRVERAEADRFDVAVDVTRIGGEAPIDPLLRFSFAGDQAVAAADDGLVQDGREVIAPVALGTESATATVRLPGTRGPVNPMPTTFFVNETRCASTVYGPPTAAPAESDRSGQDDGSAGRGNGNGKRPKDSEQSSADGGAEDDGDD